MKSRMLTCAVLLGAITSADGLVLWDNNLITNGGAGHPLSPPLFADMRIVEDIVVGPNWIIETFKMAIIEDAGWNHSYFIDVYIYHDAQGVPGSPVTYLTSLSFSREPTGTTYFGRTEYIYSIDVGRLRIRSGRYWIGARNSHASGSGTNYWMTSDGFPDGWNSSRAYSSRDGGREWRAEDSQLAFRVEGVPELSTMLAVGAGLVALAARRRRK